jgi:hypothetical protein
MHPVTFEIVRLRQDELRREADRHRAVAAVRSSRTRHRLSPAALLSAIVTRYWSPAAATPRRTLSAPERT